MRREELFVQCCLLGLTLESGRVYFLSSARLGIDIDVWEDNVLLEVYWLQYWQRGGKSGVCFCSSGFGTSSWVWEDALFE